MERIRRNKGRILLVALLAISLLGNALTAGAILRFQSMRTELLGSAGEQALFPRETRRLLREAIAGHADTLRPAVQELAQARARVVAAANAEPFDRAAVEAAMTSFRAEFDATLQLTQGLVLGVLEERAAEGS